VRCDAQHSYVFIVFKSFVFTAMLSGPCFLRSGSVNTCSVLCALDFEHHLPVENRKMIHFALFGG
jgi:hypothetical protein